MPSNPQQNGLGMESNAPIAADVGALPGLACGRPSAAANLGKMAMRAVSFFGCGWFETDAKFSDGACLFAALGSGALGGPDGGSEVPAGFGSGCKTGEAVAGAGSVGGRRTGIRGASARETVLTGDGGMTDVVSGLWGSAGSAMTNHVAVRKSLKIPSLSLAKLVGTARCAVRERPWRQTSDGAARRPYLQASKS